MKTVLIWILFLTLNPVTMILICYAIQGILRKISFCKTHYGDYYGSCQICGVHCGIGHQKYSVKQRDILKMKKYKLKQSSLV